VLLVVSGISCIRLAQEIIPLSTNWSKGQPKKIIPVAQFSLGVMLYPFGDFAFDKTKGNLAEALTWYRRAADQGDIDAQVVLGTAFADGLGVPQDFVEAHKWYNLAAARVTYQDMRIEISKQRDELASRMTSTQIAEAQKLARDWKPVQSLK
jgi:uncharacterized protein